eukprot:3612555-Pleurochrysis_carterae.AAC.1
MAFLHTEHSVPTNRIWCSYTQNMAFLHTDYGVPTHRIWCSYTQNMAFLHTDYGVPTHRIWRSFTQNIALGKMRWTTSDAVAARADAGCGQACSARKRCDAWSSGLFLPPRLPLTRR